jgi:hypothetical protein
MLNLNAEREAVHVSERLPADSPPEPPGEPPAPVPLSADAPALPAERRKRKRKAIVKHMKLERLSEPGKENPALRAVPPAEEAPQTPRTYIRVSEEKQIVSVPLLLINEQLGAAVERFNVCACDDCLRAITMNSLDLMPPMYLRVVSQADEDEVNRRLQERRAEAIRALAKVCIAALAKPFHE